MVDTVFKKVASGKIIDKSSENEIDSLIMQLQNVLNDKEVTQSITFFTASTLGGTTDKKVTIDINKFGRIVSIK